MAHSVGPHSPSTLRLAPRGLGMEAVFVTSAVTSIKGRLEADVLGSRSALDEKKEERLSLQSPSLPDSGGSSSYASVAASVTSTQAKGQRVIPPTRGAAAGRTAATKPPAPHVCARPKERKAGWLLPLEAVATADRPPPGKEQRPPSWRHTATRTPESWDSAVAQGGLGSLLSSC